MHTRTKSCKLKNRKPKSAESSDYMHGDEGTTGGLPKEDIQNKITDLIQ